ncbi:hypothetical protein Nepgr_016004 [Nepenthes gracilis]|uniref:Uncharacterized protein n=1 Tax=Nepenthes gracilis TaxID=150966 RepID=A0AAD3SLY3_NEPGR|nr:hypothetical protein Nepgr_016004 [Nepenthes gracilis]
MLPALLQTGEQTLSGQSFEYITSPTDPMISPISKGLLERSRKTGVQLPSLQILSKLPQRGPPTSSAPSSPLTLI